MKVDIYQLMEPEEAQRIFGLVKGMEWHQGKASTEKATQKLKHNLEIKMEHSAAAKSELLGLQEKLGHNQTFRDHHFPNRVFPPKFNRYSGEAKGDYGRHGDATLMGGHVRTDLSCTIFLTDPESYGGGELCLEDDDGKVFEVKGEQGQAVVYRCGVPHWVQPVTWGERISAVTWIQSTYRDPRQRSLMRRMAGLHKEMAKDEKLDLSSHHISLGCIMGEMSRMWAEHG